MNKTRIVIYSIVIVAVVVFVGLMYSWNFVYSEGTYTDEHGTYVGEFKGKIFHGYGTFDFNTGISYKGQWKDGNIEGFGILTFADGTYYEGEFKDGYYHGHGKLILPDKTVLEGNWINGHFESN